MTFNDRVNRFTEPGSPASELIKTIKQYQAEREKPGDEPSVELLQLARKADSVLRERKRVWESVINDAGCRYSDASLESFRCSTEDQENAVKALRDHMSNLERDKTKGILFIGPTGSGKDHLMMASVRYMVHQLGADPDWIDGQQLFSSIRNAYSQDESEDEICSTLGKSSLLAISDPLPTSGKLTDHQQNVLGLILDRRYRNMLPTLVTANVGSRKELYDRIGDRNADRLCEGALVIKCNWESYRQKKRQDAVEAVA